MKKTSKALAALVALTILLCGCNNGGESALQSGTAPTASTTTTAAQESAPSQSTSATQGTVFGEVTVTTDAQIDPAELSCDVQWELTASWEDNGRKCGTCEVTVVNSSNGVINGWKVTAAVPDDTDITSSWNADINVSGTLFTASNAPYNTVLEPGTTVSFGFNFSAPTDLQLSGIAVNGVGAGAASNENDSPDTPVTTVSATTAKPPVEIPVDADGTTPVTTHGQLSVSGTQLVDKNGAPYQLRGMSTHGLTWFPDYVNENAFRTLRDEWKTNVVRLAMYIDEWGNGQCYMNNKAGSKELLEKGVELCIKLDMYVIIDWHVLNPGNPNAYTEEAKSFFTEMSQKYADYPNIIYEICNEPNGEVGWSSMVKPYAEQIIPVIRANDSDAVIIVGTPTWSQDIDQALNDPLDGDNIMYALHFYAATHTDWLRDRLKTCVNGGLPVFVSEFGVCDASGNGANNLDQAEKWLSLLDELGISYCNWSLANKDESASAFKPSAGSNGDWSEGDLTESGKWISEWFKSH